MFDWLFFNKICFALQRVFSTYCEFLLLLLSFSVSLQRWDSADSERDQPCNHPRAKDKGQVWAGRILSCEYWCEWHWQRRHTLRKTQAHMHNIDFKHKHTQACSICTHMQYIHLLTNIFRQTRPHTSTSADSYVCWRWQTVCLCVLPTSCLSTATASDIWRYLRPQLFKCHCTTCVCVTKRKRKTACVCVKKKKNPEVPFEELKCFVNSIDNVHKALWRLSPWVEAL